MKPDELPAASTPEAAGGPEAAEAASPFPPAFRWEASPSEAPTQVFGAIGAGAVGGDPAAGTQTIRSSPSYQQRPNHVEDLFQPFDKPADEPVGRPADRPADNSAPPWADSELPPIAEQQDSWMRQSPATFKAPAAPRSKQIIGIVVLAIVVLGLMGATVGYFLTAGSPDRTGSGQFAASQPVVPARDLPAPPAPRPAPADTTSALIEPPGRPRGGGGLFDLPKLESANLLPQPILNTLGAGGMTDAVLKTTTSGGTTIGMFALTMPDQRIATDVAWTIAAVQRDGGLKPDDSRALQGVSVLGSDLDAASTVVYRAVYVLYNRAIYFEVFGSDRDEVLTTFDALISQQITHAPPTVWAGR